MTLTSGRFGGSKPQFAEFSYQLKCDKCKITYKSLTYAKKLNICPFCLKNTSV